MIRLLALQALDFGGIATSIRSSRFVIIYDTQRPTDLRQIAHCLLAHPMMTEHSHLGTSPPTGDDGDSTERYPAPEKGNAPDHETAEAHGASRAMNFDNRQLRSQGIGGYRLNNVPIVEKWTISQKIAIRRHRKRRRLRIRLS